MLIARNRIHFSYLKLIDFCSAQVLINQNRCDQSEQMVFIAGWGLGGPLLCFKLLDDDGDGGNWGGGWLERGLGASHEEEFKL